MSVTGIKYDRCSFMQQLRQSEGPGRYQFYSGKHYNKNNCRVAFGIVGGNDVSVYKKNMVDLESELRGQTRFNSFCSTKKYQPWCKQRENSGLPSGAYDCKQELIDLPTCNMFHYTPTVIDSPPKKPECFDTTQQKIMESFCDERSIPNTEVYVKPLYRKPCPFYKYTNLPYYRR